MRLPLLFHVTAGWWIAWCVLCTSAACQVFSVRDWPSERVELIDGRRYEGLVESQDDAWVHLIQIERPAGRPMHLVIRPIARSAVAAVVRLQPAEQAELRRQIERFLNRSRIEAGRIDAVRLGMVQRHGAKYLHYRGKWFSMESSVDEPTTRRVIVRVEQIFTAYRQILPPRTDSRRPLRLVVLGSMSEYHAYLGRLGLTIGNPACFIEDDNLVVAGSELARFAAELSKTEARHDQLRTELKQLERRLPLRLAEIAEQLKCEGATGRQIKRLLAAERGEFERQIKKKRDELNRADRTNAQKFNAVTSGMFTRLYHEAFHAYLENYVYPRKNYDVPVWLNEGQAVMFEAGVLENDTLRFDAPNRSALGRLKAELNGRRPLPLSDVLAADRRAFILDAEDDAESAERYYAYSWGLAYCLAFENRLLGTPALDEYVRPTSDGTSSVERFEKLLGTTLDKFEKRWQRYILGLR